ncbi:MULTISPECIES: hypothetical protein [Paraburkholderia]|uniref:hypothetical protein n=1 Tax=Paraburkholderia TaxID=1822464 RepID=UPI001581C546|nr:MULTISPECIES: hypothetical protein [Paraburkholderia]
MIDVVEVVMRRRAQAAWTARGDGGAQVEVLAVYVVIRINLFSLSRFATQFSSSILKLALRFF